jgi:hypothetical protein
MQPQNSNTNGHLNSLSRQDASSNEGRRVPVRTESPVNVSSVHSAPARSNTGPISGVLSSRRDSVSSSPDHSQHMLEPDNGMTHGKQPQAGPSVYRPPQQYYSQNFSHGASVPQLQQVCFSLPMLTMCRFLKDSSEAITPHSIVSTCCRCRCLCGQLRHSPEKVFRIVVSK